MPNKVVAMIIITDPLRKNISFFGETLAAPDPRLRACYEQVRPKGVPETRNRPQTWSSARGLREIWRAIGRGG